LASLVRMHRLVAQFRDFVTLRLAGAPRSASLVRMHRIAP
jgi:hypothetical protein